MSETNKDSKDFWSGKGGDIWVERQDAMDQMLFPFGEVALNKLELGQNLHVLDIGCGCGTTTLVIAERIKRGRVTGIDISQPMLQRAKKSAKEKSLTNTSLLKQANEAETFFHQKFYKKLNEGWKEIKTLPNI